MFHSFFDSHRIFDIVSPLIDDKYKATVKELYQQGNKLLEELLKKQT